MIVLSTIFATTLVDISTIFEFVGFLISFFAAIIIGIIQLLITIFEALL